MRIPIAALLVCGALCAQQQLPKLEGESLTGKKVALPAAAGGEKALVIIGFTHASQTQTKAWSLRVHSQYPTWSIAELEDVPRLVRGMVSHAIRNSIPKDQQDRFLLLYHGEKELKLAAGFEAPDDAYLLILDGAGNIHWRFHGPVTDAALDQLASNWR